MILFAYTELTRTRSACQNMRLSQILTLILTVFMLFLTRHQIATAQTVHIPDPNLRASLESALGKDAGADITQVEIASLESLDAFESGILDLTGLEFAINLTGLHLGLNQISDVAPLKNLTKLTVLDLHRNSYISDVLPLKGLTNLTWLSLRGNIISNVLPLKNLTKLTYLHIGYNRISDTTPFSVLTNLTFLNLDENRISDVKPLKTLKNLIYLALDDNKISDVSTLSVLTNLKFLNLNDNKTITNILPLSVLTKLTFLDLHGNQVSDLTPLKNMTNMTNLRLQENHIYDISPLKGMTKLTRLILHDNHISDFSPIAGVIENLIEYDDSNQTELPPHLRPVVQPFNLADVNRDGVVNITDMVLVASNFYGFDRVALVEANIYPDVNSDGVVDIIDLLIVASEIGTSDKAAPILANNLVQISNLTAENLELWIWHAKQFDFKEPYMQKGITVLEHLLKLLRTVEVLPKGTALLQNYPNPFNPDTWIPYQLAKPAKVNITIYSADGKLVRSLELGQLSIGIYRDKSRAAYWDGRNDFGESVASGPYFYTFTAGNFTAIGKMIIQK